MVSGHLALKSKLYQITAVVQFQLTDLLEMLVYFRTKTVQ